MKGKEFLNKVNQVESCIAIFQAAEAMDDGGLLTLTKDQQNFITMILNDYKLMLLDSEVQ